MFRYIFRNVPTAVGLWNCSSVLVILPLRSKRQYDNSLERENPVRGSAHAYGTERRVVLNPCTTESHTHFQVVHTRYVLKQRSAKCPAVADHTECKARTVHAKTGGAK